MKKFLKAFVLCICCCFLIVFATACSQNEIKLFVDSGAPTSTLGSSGDYYIDNSTFDIYLKEGKVWNKTGNVEAFVGEDGTNGIDGREVEFQTNGTHIQWRYVGESSWKNLIALEELKGANGADGENGQDGADGVDGREVEFQTNGTHIQWRYVGENEWKNLVSLDDLKGADGVDGTNGTNGVDGTDGATWLSGDSAPSNSIGENGDFYLDLSTYDIYSKAENVWAQIGNIKGEPGKDGSSTGSGADGREVEFQTNATHIQWRYVGESSWKNLIALDELKGVDGADGENGQDGTDGTIWYTSSTDPQVDLGADGDFYVNTTTFELFIKTEGEWTYLGSLKNKYLIGDVNGDGVVNHDDALYLLQYTFLPETYPIPSEVITDFNEDSLTTEYDAILLEYYVRGVINTLPFTEDLSTINLVLGDANLDGFVDENDYILLSNHLKYPNNTQYFIITGSNSNVDLNDDGEIDSSDAILLAKFIYKNETPEITSWTAQYGDIDCNGEITDWDAILLDRLVNNWSIFMCDELFKFADLNNDGNVNMLDVAILRKYSVTYTGFETLPYTGEWKGDLGDLNYDGKIDIEDLELLRQYIKNNNSVAIDISLADLNGDEEIDDSDVILLAKAVYDKVSSVTVTEWTAQYGDIDCNGEITDWDAILLDRLVNNWSIFMCDELFKYCDLNGDGSVSKIDALILTRNLASWSGYETLPIQNLKAIGDFNDDGNINSNDYTALLDAINTSNEILQTVQNVLCVDFNLDGVVDNTDAIILYNYINNNFAFKELTYIDYTQKYGDLNCDGVITIDDLVILRAHVNQTETIDCEPLLDFADLNGDGEVNSEDVTILKNFLNGEDITLPQVA